MIDPEVIEKEFDKAYLDAIMFGVGYIKVTEEGLEHISYEKIKEEIKNDD